MSWIAAGDLRGWFDLLRPCRAGRGGRGPSGEQACAGPAACRHAESTAAAEDLLTGIVERGRIDGEKQALRARWIEGLAGGAVRRVFGKVPVQRCRAHKLRNVVERLPKAERDQAKAAIRAAWRLGAQDGQARLEKLAQWYEGDWPEAAASLREGMEECFTINRLGVPPSLHRCLATTNIVESPNAGVRRRTRRVTRWKDAAMVCRWATAAFLDTEKSFRKIMGYKDLWMLDAILNPASATGSKAA